MGSFVGFMESSFGRLLRIVAGVALLVVGLFFVQGVWGYVLAAVDLVPVVAGLGGICLFAPLVGYTLQGAPRRVHVDR
jgi:hypothetical protein